MQELHSARTLLATAMLQSERARFSGDGTIWDESRGLSMEVMELSAALEAEQRRAELVAQALDHAQRSLDEANAKLQRQKKEQEKCGFQPGMSRAQELQSLKEQLLESRERESKSTVLAGTVCLRFVCASLTRSDSKPAGRSQCAA